MSGFNLQQAISLAMQLHQSGRHADAEHLLRQILARQPASGDVHANLADVLVRQGKPEAAINALQSALANRPSNPAGCLSNLSVLFYQLGRYPDAALACRQAIAMQPGNPLPHRNLADALLKLEEYDLAEKSYKTALKLNPRMQDLHNGIGLTLYHRGRFVEALGEFEAALKFDPGNVNACLNGSLCHGRLGNPQANEATLRQTLALSPHEPELSSSLIMALNYNHGDDPGFMLRESLEYDRRYIAPWVAVSQLRRKASTANHRLRIGYVSPDFRHHPVSFFLEPVLMHHDRKHFQIACYAEVEKADDKTALYQGHADLWRNTVGRGDDEIADQIRADEIDILIDLAGHTLGNRLGIFARRPAPLQITWLGYPNTTGVSTIDYRLTDARADPPETEIYYSEKLIRLPEAFFVYQPPPAPPTGPLPMLSNGHITFGSFNNIVKITPLTCSWWVQILQAVPDARLLLAGVRAGADEKLRTMLAPIAADRIEIAEFTADMNAYLHLFDRVDIALDAYPWTGHTTTCHSLWMGVPVVSLAGPTAVSRAGMSVMGALGMDRDWVATTREEYVSNALKFAGEPERLATLRSELRERLRQSPIMDADRFTRNYESLLRKLHANVT